MRHLPFLILSGVALLGVGSAAALAGPTELVGDQGLAATYMAGNLEEISAGAEGKLVLGGDSLAFTAGKNVVLAPYKQIQNVELGDPIEQKRKGFHITKKPMLARRQLTITYADAQMKPASDPRTITLEMDEDDAAVVSEQIELRIGKRRRVTNGDSWWGDSAWKTKRNGNAVKPDAIGTVDSN